MTDQILPPGAASPSPVDLVERGLAEAARLTGVASTSVIVRQDSSVNLRWAAGTLTTNGVTTGQSVTVVQAVRGTDGIGVGAVTRRGVGLDDLPGLVADAHAAAAAAPPAEDAGDLPLGSTDRDFAEPGPVTGPGTLATFAAGLGDVLGRAGAAGRELFGFAQHDVTTTWLGTSAGARRRHVQPQGTVELTGKSHDRTRSTWVGRGTRDFTDIDIAALDEEIETRLGWQSRRLDLAPGRYDTVLPASSVADLMIYAYWSADARGAHEGRSVFSARGGSGGTRVGEQLTDLPLNLSSDPDHPGLGCEPFLVTSGSSPFASVFDNGMDTPAVSWMDRGRLVALPSSRHTADLTGLGVHPPVDNLLLSSGAAAGGLADLVSGTERGLLVTSLWYIREVDPASLLLTGLTRDGVYLVEDGEVSGAVTNFRFNESPVDLLQRIDAAGVTEPALSREWSDFFPRTAMPPVRVRDFNMSSVSPAS